MRRHRLLIVLVAASALGLSTAPAAEAAVAPAAPSAETRALAGPSIAPAAGIAAIVQEARHGKRSVRTRLRCTTWAFKPLTTTRCLKGEIDHPLVKKIGADFLVRSKAGTWRAIPYSWNPAKKRLELDARKKKVSQPGTRKPVRVWRWKCSQWTLKSGTTLCTHGKAQRVWAKFGRSPGPARIRSPKTGKYETGPYRWDKHGGFLALDGRLVPAASLSLGAMMSPRPSASISDFAVHCPGGEVTATIRARAGGRVRVEDAVYTAAAALTVPLSPGQALHWRLKFPGKDAIRQQARCLPEDLPSWTSSRTGQPRSQWYVLTPTLTVGSDPPGPMRYVVVVDDRGTPVWWRGFPSYAPIDAKILPDGALSWAENGFTFSQISTYHTSDWAGVEGPTLGVGLSLDHHDLEPTADGNYLAIRYVYRDCFGAAHDCVDMSFAGGSSTGTIIDCEVVKFSPTGDVLWTWKARDHISMDEWSDLARIDLGGDDFWDIHHLNSVEEDGDGIIVSFRHLDAVYRVRTSDGGIDWKLGGTPTPESLTISGAGAFPVPSHQHDARRLPNGHVSIFDNETAADRPPRVIEFALDTNARTATVVRQITDSEVAASLCCGSAHLVAGGGWVIAWGGTSRVSEVDAAGKRLLTLDFQDVFSYRAYPVEPGKVSRATLVAGMDAMFDAAAPAPPAGFPQVG